jgi:hypothetical protein
MTLHQISVFLENSPGKAAEPCSLLSRAGINIRTLTLADTKQFGILRLIVSDWERCRELLKEAGYVVNVTEVVAVEVDDRPGGLASLLESLGASGVNIEYMYAFAFGKAARAVLIFRFDRPEDALRRLQAAGINVVQGLDL